MSPPDEKPRRVKHGHSGHLFSQDGLSVPVTITQHGDDLLLVIMEGAEAFLSGPLDVVVLESSGARGVVRTPGDVEAIEANLLRFSYAEAAELVQRREFVRVTAAKRVVLEDGDGELLAEALTVDISGGGLLIQLPRAVELPEAGGIHFSLYLGVTDYDDEVSGTLRLVRRKPDNQVAMAFEHISRNDQERLIRFVFERQRVALRVTRGD